jgi:hypothetical protein
VLGYTNRLRQNFADQFEPDGDFFLYRRSSRGAPIRVSAQERAAYIAAFDLWLRWCFWALFAGFTALILVEVIYFYPSSSQADWIFGSGIAALFAFYMAAFLWAWNAPTRQLRGRGSEGEGRSHGDVRRRMLAKQSYWQILASPAIFALLILNEARTHDLLSGWYRLWLVGLALVSGISLVAALQKWRLETPSRD